MKVKSKKFIENMHAERFEDLIAWKNAKLLVIDTYRLFRSCKDYAFKDQIQRAAISITNNIAEGFERRTGKELINFLYIAKGSCGEMRSMINIAVELGYLERKNARMLWLKSEEVSKIIYGLIRSLK